jgi:hypothetical protein
MEFERQQVPGMQRKRIQNALKVAVPIAGTMFVTLLAIGLGVGKYQSPAFDHATLGPIALMNFVAEHGAIEGNLILTKTDLSRGQIPAGTKLKFICGIRAYVFDPASGLVSTRESTDAETGRDYWGQGMRKQLNSFDAALGAILGGTAIAKHNLKDTYGSAYRTWRMSNSTTRFSIATVAIPATVGGYAIGFTVGYAGLPDCGTDTISKTLKDPEFWKALHSRPLLVGEILIRSKIARYDAVDPARANKYQELLKSNDARSMRLDRSYDALNFERFDPKVEELE